jgi:hypothetical protein
MMSLDISRNYPPDKRGDSMDRSHNNLGFITMGSNGENILHFSIKSADIILWFTSRCSKDRER